MKPVFANTFNATSNKNKTEIVLNFTHVYTEHNFTAKNGSLTDVSAQVCGDVASILLSHDGAVALAKLLNKVLLNDSGEDIELR